MLALFKSQELRKIRKSTIVRLIVECILTVVLLLLSQNFFKLIGPPKKRGFFCNDESLKYPYHGDTINLTILRALTLYLPLIIIIICNCVLFLVLRKQQTTSSKDMIFKQILFSLYHNIIPFLCCFAMHTFFVYWIKSSLGRLRPHFFEVCQPFRRLDNSTCADAKNQGLYIEDYECNVINRSHITKWMLYGIHSSFPSGHASYIWYGMVYTLLYLQRFSTSLRQYKINVGLLMIVLQMSCALLAWFVTVSRVMDYKHHWSDVLVGSLLGTSVAIAVSFYVCQQLNSVNKLLEDVKSSNPADMELSTTKFVTTVPNITFFP